MSWLTFAEAYTLGTFYLVLCMWAWQIGVFIGEESLPGSTTRTFVALMVGIWDFNQVLDRYLGEAALIENLITGHRRAA